MLTLGAVAATNLAINPGLESGVATGWYTNNAAVYPVTLDTSGTMTGANSMRSDRIGTLSAAAASIYCGPSPPTGFPCTPGQPITASVDVKHDQANRKVGMYFSWLDAANAIIGNLPTTYTVPDSGAANTTRRSWVTGIPPANAASARVIVTSTTVSGGNAVLGEKVWFDNLRVSTGPGTLDDTNQHPNPDVSSAVSYYWLAANNSLYPVTVDATSQMTGQYSVVQTRTGTLDRTPATLVFSGIASPGSNMACTPGVRTYLGVDVKVELAGRKTELYYQYFDAAGTYLGTGPRGVYNTMTAGVKTRLTYSEVPPANAVMCRPVVVTTTLDGSNAVVGERVWYDNSYFGTNSAAASFSGVTPPDGTFVYRWTGSPWANTTERYRISGTEQWDTRYFDGGSSVDDSYSYRWTGAVRASTSERVWANITNAWDVDDKQLTAYQWNGAVLVPYAFST